MRLTPDQLDTLRLEAESGDASPSDLEDGIFLLLQHIEAVETTLQAVRDVRKTHPECEKTEFTCGWKHAVQDIDAALRG